MENKKLAKESQAFPSFVVSITPRYFFFLVDTFLKGSFQQLQPSFYGNKEFLGLFHWHILHTTTHKFYEKSFNERFFLENKKLTKALVKLFDTLFLSSSHTSRTLQHHQNFVVLKILLCLKFCPDGKSFF